MSEIVVTRQDEWLSELELKSLAVARIAELRKQGAPISISSTACEAVLAAALSMLEGRGFIDSKQGLLRARKGMLDVLNYYANSIRQWREQDSATTKRGAGS